MFHALTCKKTLSIIRRVNLWNKFYKISVRNFQTFDMNYVLFSKLFSLDANSIKAEKYFLIICYMPRSMAGTMGDVKIFL